MNNRQIIIDAPDGQVIDMEHFNQTGNVRFIDEKPEKIEFPKEWELKYGTNYYIDIDSKVKYCEITEKYINPIGDKNILPTKSLAEQMLIFTQLITMRERYREIEKFINPELGDIDWDECSSKKECVVLLQNQLQIASRWETNATFSFRVYETAHEFAKNFGDMILQCKDILG